MASQFSKHQIEKSGMGNEYGSLARFHNRCCCHPQEYGLKKGLRRARRRADKEIVERELREADEEL